MSCRLAGAVLLIVLAASLAGEEPVKRSDAVADLRHLFASLEEIHPDPYSAFGGKIAFKRAAQSLIGAVPAEGLTPSKMYDVLTPFFAQLGDGHTRIYAPERPFEGSAPRYLPIRFAIASDAIFVSRAVSPWDELIGHRVESIEGIPIDDLKSIAAKHDPAENEYGSARNLIRLVRSSRNAKILVPDGGEELEIQLIDAAGSNIQRTIPFSLSQEESSQADWNARGGKTTDDDSPIFWRFLGDSGVAYLRIRTMTGREAFEEALASGREDLREYVNAYLEQYGNEAVPEQLEDALASVPCLTGTITELLAAMARGGSRSLIIDLRDNGGGWSSLATPLYLLMYGKEYLDYDFPESWTTSISKAYLDLYNTTIDQLNAESGTRFEVGDYRFEATAPALDSTTFEEYVEGLDRFGCGLRERIAQLQGKPMHRPEVIVLVNTGTFSAAYHLAYRLRHLGATLVGVPPAQAGNAFTDVTLVELPSSKLRAGIARSLQVYFPDDEKLGEVLIPDVPMGWKDFERYGYDVDAEVLRAIELARSGK